MNQDHQDEGINHDKTRTLSKKIRCCGIGLLASLLTSFLTTSHLLSKRMVNRQKTLDIDQMNHTEGMKREEGRCSRNRETRSDSKARSLVIHAAGV